jgi:hypothetical protein
MCWPDACCINTENERNGGGKGSEEERVSGAAVTQQCRSRVRELRLAGSQVKPAPHPVLVQKLHTCSCASGKEPTTAPNNYPTNPPLSELSPRLSSSHSHRSGLCSPHDPHRRQELPALPRPPARASVSQVTLPPFSLPSVRVSSRSLARWIRFRMVDWWAD